MRRTTPVAYVATASAAVFCLGGVLTGCGSAAGSGYAAVGAAGPADPSAPTRPAPPRDGVELTPLDGGGATGPSTPPGSPGSSGPSRPTAPGTTGTTPPGTPGASDGSGTPPSAPPGSTTGQGSNPPGTKNPAPPGGSPAPGPGGSTTPEPPAPPSPTIPAGPNAPSGLVVGKPVLADTDVRWCQRVTIDFLNTGQHPVTAGTVTFGSHVIGALGIDWATLDSTRDLPLPLSPGKPETGTWRVCVDAWRVPLGMHLNTKDVTFKWK
ncbi:hypothetical protein [Streptomyces noursei]|uniref:Secreted protein n=1 Tax=Streptomyces noursei TaxID=1971 RepID=A0A401R4E6_STRNR|nr:hypothetical protein [Streptomyces noursei]EPY92558.1 hypothetical protein K530_52620 [Streptomyces noursei CCRC 11814]UWS73440.1 hypothetical protein N1H47_20645 [Streptomyces noursei]GCB92480.1 hypothetical protein SALB_05246 [Streptomyces noursei]